ncbi:MAG: hypothetical protein RLZZ574_337 [Cyanobacteriota bacterium]|jgi:hypothetical protein
MINNIDIELALVEKVQLIGEILIVNLSTTQGDGQKNYFPAKFYQESSELDLKPGSLIAISQGKIAFYNQKAYVAVNYPSQVKILSEPKATLPKSVIVSKPVIANVSKPLVMSAPVIEKSSEWDEIAF